MIYVLESENSVEISMEGSAENIESSAIVETPKEWPKKSAESFTDYALPTLVFGMLGIFLVLGLISLATIGLNKLFPGNKQ